MIRTFQGVKPTIADSAYIEETAVVIGDVVIGEESSVWFNSVVRGDVHFIKIGSRTNIQDLSVIHVTHDIHPTVLGDDVTVGHRVVLHGCTLKDRVLVGMGAILMDGVVIGEDCIVGAGALITEGTMVPPKSLIVGFPAKVKRSITDRELTWIKESARNYVEYSRQYLDGPEKSRFGFQV
jgi:carbonic anhydrase/acetyltransferase-like protein (isoleucine patch superfamily)